MNRELRDELEVPGHVFMVETMTVREIVEELKKIMDEWERQGIKKVNDVPDGPERRRFLMLNERIGIKIHV
jgi:hypothetical protein